MCVCEGDGGGRLRGWLFSVSSSSVEKGINAAAIGNTTTKGVAMCNFTCQPDWAMGCPDSWLNIMSGCVCEGVSRRG